MIQDRYIEIKYLCDSSAQTIQDLNNQIAKSSIQTNELNRIIEEKEIMLVKYKDLVTKKEETLNLQYNEMLQLNNQIKESSKQNNTLKSN